MKIEATRIEAIRLKNFKAFKDLNIKNIPAFCVFIGANGTGKTSIFSIFDFLHHAMSSNVNNALSRLGGSQGFKEVRSRGTTGAIEFEFKFREKADSPIITYSLRLNEKDGKAYVESEILKYRRGSKGQPWHFLDFKNGKGDAITNEYEKVENEKDLTREEQTLKSNDILAIKGLAQFEKFPAVLALGNLIENWHISDFHISKARPDREFGYAEHLSREGENLASVIEYYYKHHRKIFDKIVEQLQKRVPGITQVEPLTTQDGRILLKFKDDSFEEPFIARHVSDGTIKMLAYLALLYDPKQHSLLCVEEPENQLYPRLLGELAEEFREYSTKGQVFVTTHSPDFLNAVNEDEVFWLEKKDGYTIVKRASEYPQIKEYMKSGDKMGALWKEGHFGKVDP